ncbi:DgyrCDS298 [Dimorphilus gyrociliatus]|uniref:DgyrCDS298 n=1 Tax=Dimorphilus gyrociliatus TaxID=2664684 RepID=A0A7I8V5N1_9ANNE|nr:DgyrCDS298 [Dimorphilus gyrociliatus]
MAMSIGKQSLKVILRSCEKINGFQPLFAPKLINNATKRRELCLAFACNKWQKHIQQHLPTEYTPEELITWSRTEAQELCTKRLQNALVESGGHQKTLECCTYVCDGSGKLIRPQLVLLTAGACFENSLPSSDQKTIAMIAEVIHTASLVHDDIVDNAELRRKKPSSHLVFGDTLTTFVADYMISVSSQLLARLRNPRVIKLLSQAMNDIVRGELSQQKQGANLKEQFSLYMDKTFAKTASLTTNACAAVAVLAKCNDQLVENARNIGKHVGLAYQLVDDLLDLVSTEEKLGKPAVADMKLGLATAPALLAARDSAKLQVIIQRRYSQDGDIENALELIEKYDGIQKTRDLAKEHTLKAIENARQLPNIVFAEALHLFIERLLGRYF